jgi:hypothetical protein
MILTECPGSSVGRAVGSRSKGPRFDPSCLHLFNFFVKLSLCLRLREFNGIVARDFTTKFTTDSLKQK